VAGSNFEREYAALLRVGDRAVSRVLHTGHRYDVRSDRSQRLLLDVNSDDLDFSGAGSTPASVKRGLLKRKGTRWPYNTSTRRFELTASALARFEPRAGVP
jgi:hypothetical protein